MDAGERLVTYPVGYSKGAKVPLLLRIHGGPNSQDQHSFSAERQVFAAMGTRSWR